MRLLVAQDDQPLAHFVKRGLEREHYAVQVAADGEQARWLALQQNYDLMVLDLNLPQLDGLELLAEVRAKKAALPVLVLTGRSGVEDCVKALDLGADDYVTKPFSFCEFVARVRALLRRAKCSSETVLRVEDLELSRLEHRARRADRHIELTPKEFALLEYLMRNCGHPVTRAMILQQVWNLAFDTISNVVDVYINYLRKKVDDGFERKLIRTIRGVGYQIGGQGQDRQSGSE